MSINRIKIAAILLAPHLPTLTADQDAALIARALRRADALICAHLNLFDEPTVRESVTPYCYDADGDLLI